MGTTGGILTSIHSPRVFRDCDGSHGSHECRHDDLHEEVCVCGKTKLCGVAWVSDDETPDPCGDDDAPCTHIGAKKGASCVMAIEIWTQRDTNGGTRKMDGWVITPPR